MSNLTTLRRDMSDVITIQYSSQSLACRLDLCAWSFPQRCSNSPLSAIKTHEDKPSHTVSYAASLSEQFAVAAVIQRESERRVSESCKYRDRCPGLWSRMSHCPHLWSTHYDLTFRPRTNKMKPRFALILCVSFTFLLGLILREHGP
jgi:hypothetical protein